MAALHELIQKIENPELRAQIQAAADKLTKQKKFGLVFEEHLPECTPLYDIPVRKGSKVSVRDKKANETYMVLKIEDGKALCLPKNSKEAVEFDLCKLVTTAELGDPIYPCLQPMGEVCNAPDSGLWHTLIEADNYHALQLLEYLYAGKVDCIYIDPPYNTGAKDWKYNNDYVDENDEYRHSMWLSFIQKRLKIAKKLLNPDDSALIVTIDEKEYLHLGCLLEDMFPDARIQMISSIINPTGTKRADEFSRTNEFIYFVRFGSCSIQKMDVVKTVPTNSEVHWEPLRRHNAGNLRSKTSTQFYPIYIDISTNQIKEIGRPVGKDIPVEDIPSMENCETVLPIRDNGLELMWGMKAEELQARLSKGYVKVGARTPNKPQKYVISYLTTGTIEDIETGKATTLGYDANGVIKAFYEEGKKVIPTTQWSNSLHDAKVYGTLLLQPVLNGIRFAFPKSLYAVMDCIQLVTAHKREALIVDFFAGSGTTLHAINLLNASDGGNRRCVMVTNNEISEAEKNAFEECGIKQGDLEWENRGIARYVTWPRTVCSILGKDVIGNPLEGNYGVEEEEYVLNEEDVVVSKKTGKIMSKKIYVKQKVQKLPSLASIKKSDGFKTNAAFFKLGFVDKTKVSLGMQFKELLSILWMKAGAIGKCPVIDRDIPAMLILPENRMAILNDENCFGEFAEQIVQHPEIDVVYLVTDYESSFVAMTQALEGKTTYQLYRDYLDNFRINAGRNGR